MPKDYSPNGSPMPGTIPVLQTGEVATQDDFTDAICKPLINGVGYCQNAIGTGTIVDIFDVEWYPASGFAATTTSFDWIQYEDAGTGGIMRGRIRDLPKKITVTQIRIWVLPATHTGLPATKPVVNVYDYVVATGAPAIGPIATLTDPSASFNLYDLYHPLVASSLSLAIDTATKAYLLVLIGESSTNAVNGLAAFTRAEVTYHY